MEYQEQQMRRIQIFEDTLKLCWEDRMMDAVRLSREQMAFYREPTEELQELKVQRFGSRAEITVTRHRSLEAARRLKTEYPGARIGVLNFASAVNPGGGVIRGSAAQEECLCRCSTLYPCLNVPYLWEQYYGYHKEQQDCLYTDRCIYIPGVTILKTDTEWPEPLEEAERYQVDIITCAAPNLQAGRYAGEKPVSTRRLQEVLERRIEGIVRVAVGHGIDVLVLGAFGCGAFGNDPVMVAGCFQTVIKRYCYAFQALEFAVYCPPGGDENYRVFSEIFFD